MMEMANDNRDGNRDGNGMTKAAGMGWDGPTGNQHPTPPTAAATRTPSNFTKMMALNDNAKKKVILNWRWW